MPSECTNSLLTGKKQTVVLFTWIVLKNIRLGNLAPQCSHSFPYISIPFLIGYMVIFSEGLSIVFRSCCFLGLAQKMLTFFNLSTALTNYPLAKNMAR